MKNEKPRVSKTLTSNPSVSRPLVSVVIPSYNSQKYIEKCLNSLMMQKTKVPYEIIVVDSSKDDAPQIVAKKFPRVKLIRLQGQTYPGGGRNIGIEDAQGKIIAFIDSDCVAHPNWINDALTSINKGYSIVGGSVKNANPQSNISIADFILTFNEFLIGMPKREVQFMPTCNLFCKKEVFGKIGGFSPDLLAGEDTLFNYKAIKEFKLLFNPNIKIAHHNRESFSKFVKHHYNFGQHSARLRKKINLPGSFLAKYSVLALMVPFVKLARISFRMVRWNRFMLPEFILSFPLVFVGAMVWGWGFVITVAQKD